MCPVNPFPERVCLKSTSEPVGLLVPGTFGVFPQQIQERQQMNVEGMESPVPNLLASLNLLEPEFLTEEGQKGMEVSLCNGSSIIESCEESGKGWESFVKNCRPTLICPCLA